MDLMGVIFRRNPESEQLVSALCLGAGTSGSQEDRRASFFLMDWFVDRGHASKWGRQVCRTCVDVRWGSFQPPRPVNNGGGEGRPGFLSRWCLGD